MASIHKSIERARRSLLGLSVGDAFGQQFFSSRAVAWIHYRSPPEGPWNWTDDTAMAIPIVEELIESGSINQDCLAKRFAENYVAEPDRGYGGGAAKLLQSISQGDDWRKRSSQMFDGTGSMGNGGAMRVAPLGAYFAGDCARAAEQARLSSEVTHKNPEGIAGTIAVAIAASIVADQQTDPKANFATVIDHLDDTVVRAMIKKDALLSPDASVDEAVALLGSGDALLAWDTVPFTLWVALHLLDSFETAIWKCVEGKGDRDTTSAIVGGILAAGGAMPPDEWVEATESIPAL